MSNTDTVTWATRYGDTVEVYCLPSLEQRFTAKPDVVNGLEEVEIERWYYRVRAANRKLFEYGLSSYSRRRAAIKAAERYHPPVEGCTV